MENWKRTTAATLEVAGNGYMLRIGQDEITLVYDNGYMLRIGQDEMVLVYEGTKLPDDIGGELLSDLDDLIDKEEHDKFKITVTIEPL